MKKIIVFIVLIFLISCSFVDIQQKDNSNNGQDNILDVAFTQGNMISNIPNTPNNIVNDILNIEKKYINQNDLKGFISSLIEYNIIQKIVILNQDEIDSINAEIAGEKKDDYEHSWKFLAELYANIGFQESEKSICESYLKNKWLEGTLFTKKEIFYSHFIKNNYYRNIWDRKGFLWVKIWYGILFSEISDHSNLKSFSDLFLCDKNKSNYDACMERKNIILKWELSDIKNLLLSIKKDNNILYDYLSYKTNIITQDEFIKKICK